MALNKTERGSASNDSTRLTKVLNRMSRLV